MADALAKLKAGDAAGARAIVEPLAASSPKDGATLEAMGRVLLAQGDPDTAAKWIQRAIDAEPDVASHHGWMADALNEQIERRGRSLRVLGIARHLRSELLRTLELDPGHLDAGIGLVRFYREAPSIAGGSESKALAQARELAKRHPLHGHLMLADIAADAKDWATMEAESRAAVAADATSVEAGLALAQALTQQDKAVGAIAAAQRVLALDEGNPFAAYVIGRTGAVTGQKLELAERSLRELLARTDLPKALPVAVIRWRLGQVLERRSDAKAAREQYELAVQSDPKFEPAKQSLQALR